MKNSPATLLAPFRYEVIDWDLSPEMAVTLYLEWGNNNWHAAYPPVRSRSDVATYFVVDAWHRPPQIRLVRRNSEQADDLVSFALPEPLATLFYEEYGDLRGVFEPLPAIKDWLRHMLDEDGSDVVDTSAATNNAVQS